ncbi:MAG: glycosyltransferase, partial [Nitrospiria bacterium]
MDKVSVVVPVFNEEKTLPNFLNQMEGLSADEVVLVDGGSRDQTGDILQKWSKAQSGRCRRVLSSASKGRANQMNEGGREATGDILLFLHADSTFPPNGVDAILEALHPSSVVGGAFCLKIDSPVFFLKVVSMMANLR